MQRIFIKAKLGNWQGVCGSLCFVAGIIGPLLGLLLLAGDWAVGSFFRGWVHAAGTALLILGIPLVLFAGVCLDWSEHNKIRGR